MPEIQKALIVAIIASVKQTWKAFPSLKDFAKRFGEAMRYKTISDFALELKFATSIQIRLSFEAFDTS